MFVPPYGSREEPDMHPQDIQVRKESDMSFSINTAALSTRNRQRSRPVLGRQKGSMHKAVV